MQPEQWVHGHLFDTVCAFSSAVTSREGTCWTGRWPGPASGSEQPPSAFCAHRAGGAGPGPLPRRPQQRREREPAASVAVEETPLVHAPAPPHRARHSPRTLQPAAARGAAGFGPGEHRVRSERVRSARRRTRFPLGTQGTSPPRRRAGARRTGDALVLRARIVPEADGKHLPAKEPRVGKRLFLKNGGDLPGKVLFCVTLPETRFMPRCGNGLGIPLISQLQENKQPDFWYAKFAT